jgi:mannitol/fructose-specific phosphotransferase system IIA component (Ntr-type)
MFGEKRFRICVKGTNIIVNVKASNEQEAFTKALQVLNQVGLTNDSLNELRNLMSGKTVCK